MSLSSQIHFRFTAQEIPATVLTDMKNLTAFTTEQLIQYIPICFELCNGFISSAEEQLTTFATQFGIKLRPLRAITSSITWVLTECLQRNLSGEVLRDELCKFGWSEEHAKLVSDEWKKSFVILTSNAAMNTLTANEIIDFTWKFGVTASSNECKSIGNCFLQLQLTLRQGDCERQQWIELTLPQFYEFLQQMQSANRIVEQMIKSSA
jgi:hypothetical protein